MGQPLLSGSSVCNMLENEVFECEITFGAAVVTSVRGRDITFARTIAGTYTLTLPRIYRKLNFFSCDTQSASAAAILKAVVTTNNIATDGTITIESRLAAGTVTEMVSGQIWRLKVEVSNNPNNDYTV